MTIAVTIDLARELEEHVLSETGEDGTYPSVADYFAYLVRRDKERAERARFEVVKAKLQAAFAEPESECIEITADEFLEQMRSRQA